MSESSKLAALQADVDVFAAAVPSTPLASLPGWGSLTILLVILHGETRYGVALAGTGVRACATVADLLQLFPEKP
jgi:hypothetical protein